MLDENGEPVTRIMGQGKEDDVRKPIDQLLSRKKTDTPATFTKRY